MPFPQTILEMDVIQHLVGMVRRYGPLWTHSCFPFESFNSYLISLIHGTGNVLPGDIQKEDVVAE